MNYCAWMYRIDSADPERWEPEVLDLATISRSGVSIPPGFVISSRVYASFFSEKSLKSQIAKLTKGLVTTRPQVFSGVSKEVRSLILKTTLSREISDIFKVYITELKTRLLHGKDIPMRLVLTGVGEGSVSVSQSIRTAGELEKAVRQLYSLLFTDSDLFQRVSDGVHIMPEPFSIIVQFLPDPTFSGEVTSDQTDENVMMVRSWPLLAPKDTSLSTEDCFRIDRKSLTLLSRSIQKQLWAEASSGKFVSPIHLSSQPLHLTDEQAIQLTRLTKQAQSVLESPTRFKFAYSHSQFLITQAIQMSDVPVSSPSLETALLHGFTGNLGRMFGPARIIKTKKDQEKVEVGDVVVVDHLLKGDEKWLKKAVGFVSESGTKISIESALARKLMIPAVVATGKAKSTIKNGQIITVDGTNGQVYAGKIDMQPKTHFELPVTGTKIYSTVIDPYALSGKDLEKSDGVGLLRGEFIIRLLGVHPQDLLKRSLAEEYTELLAEGIARVARQMAPHPVVYQLHDLTSMDLLGLRSKYQDRHEPNPSLGYRGAHRLLSEPEVLDLELQALASLAKIGISNFEVMVPMVRSLEEVNRIQKYIADSELSTHLPVKLWVKCETPGLLIQMNELCEMEIGGVCFDVPSLNQFIQGIDKENRQVAHHLDSTNSAALQALHYAIATCREYGIPSSIVAEHEDLRPEVVQMAVQAGVTAVSVAPSDICATHHLVAAIEQRMLLEYLVNGLEDGQFDTK